MSSRLLVFFGAILILTACGWTGQVNAGDESVDYTQFSLDDLMEMNVVSGASKYMQKASEAPSSISIVTAEEIRTQKIDDATAQSPLELPEILADQMHVPVEAPCMLCSVLA